jgi:hypothetical protein
MGLLSQLFKARVSATQYSKTEKVRVENFNRRWKKLWNIHQSVVKDFLQPLEPLWDKMSRNEYLKLNGYIQDMNDWRNEINRHINNATQSHLSRYATAIKKTAMKSMELCQKYGVYPDIQSIEYVASEKTLYLNGKKYYMFT